MTQPALDLPEPNIPLLRKAVEWAEVEAAKTDGTCLWRQEDWAQQTDCGTAYCIAGYVVMNVHPGASLEMNEGLGFLLIDGASASFGETAGDMLGLTETERWDLFADHNDIADVRRIAEGIAARAGERL